MINFEIFNSEEPVFVQNINIEGISKQRVEEYADSYMRVFEKSSMQVVLNFSNKSYFECIYSGKYDTVYKLIDILKDLRDADTSDIKTIEQIITFFERNKKLDELLE